MVIARLSQRLLSAVAACAALPLAGVAFAQPVRAAERCAELLPQQSVIPPSGPLSTDELVRLRDIGQPDSSLFHAASPLGISPDGAKVAFVISRADPSSNGYCRGLVVMDIRTGAQPRVIDQGGDLITVTQDMRALVTPGGFPELVIPAWSPDGRWIAYLRREGGVTQIWQVRPDGTGSRQVTSSMVDIESVAWSTDGRSLLYVARPGTLRARQSIEEEGRSGYLYDERFVPTKSQAPQLPAPIPREFFAVDAETDTVREATKEERVAVAPDTSPDWKPETKLLARSASGRIAWTAPPDASHFSKPRLWTTAPDGERAACAFSACSGDILGLWWSPDGRTLNFLKREGWANEETAFYRWSLRALPPRKILSTKDALLGCQMVAGRLLCLRENATTPRRLTLLDPETGSSRDIFDPNPEVAPDRLGRVERIKWRNDAGLQAWGDLVLPKSYRAGERLPLIVVQYRSNGFLRGGTGDEYPVFPFAARGYAVLSLERPAFFATSLSGLKTFAEATAAMAQGWRERRSLLSSLQHGVQVAIDQGIADPARIGITGLSDGATTARWALINSRMFSAASISTCCMEPLTVMTLGGIGWENQLKKDGYPSLTQRNDEFWRPASFAVNAKRLSTPILMQVSSDEYALALEAFTALRDYDQPVEMYVFPDEYHIKWQPAHRLAIYNRNLDWFDYWLRGTKDPAAGKITQYQRWDRLRAHTPP
jgi:dipeptidyl aminopeptidase/acylaminoacyl peptidase